jgi:hypothetical protein
MVKIEELATLEELQGLGWVTTAQARDKGVPDYMVYRWGPALEENELARKLPLPGRGIWIVSPEGLAFLKRRRGKVGRPGENGDGMETIPSNSGLA